jgi:hypothetical protein
MQESTASLFQGLCSNISNERKLKDMRIAVVKAPMKMYDIYVCHKIFRKAIIIFPRDSSKLSAAFSQAINIMSVP